MRLTKESELSLLVWDTCWHTLRWWQMSEVKAVVTLQHVSIREARKWCRGENTCFMIECKALVPLCAYTGFQQCKGLRFFQSKWGTRHSERKQD